MSTLTNILDRSTDLPPEKREWLHLLTGDWQILADIAFADLVLYVCVDDMPLAAAQTRPATAATLYDNDVVGETNAEFSEDIHAAAASREVLSTDGQDINYTFVPVNCAGEIIAVLMVASALVPDRVPGQAQENYEDIRDHLIKMITTGDFPLWGAPTGYKHGTPRVSDGLIHLDNDGRVSYASPNAVSHFRRLGVETSLAGNVLVELVTNQIRNQVFVDESLPVVLLGRAAWLVELEANGVIISLRAVPLSDNGRRAGALILCRDISELRRQERELITKDTTIREIHHRVKNNLQTVSALLRLQARRATSEETRASLAAAQRRVSAIAVVHDCLSQNLEEIVDFDEVFVPVMRMVRDVSITDSQVVTEFQGTFGEVSAEQATALGVVMNEIIANAVEHGLQGGGHLTISAQRNGTELNIDVIDDGVGIPGSPAGLGTQIVRTMVAGELNGTIVWNPRPEGGTIVELRLRMNVNGRA
ncbi:MAG: histidine kinase N-terminal domain-containing protein [Trueperella sp.]|nr:histidine kinase N-terminal domain-containing protein [Trueperella sp.]